MEARALSKDARVAPRKVRLVINLVRGKKVDEALNMLQFVPTPTAKVVAKAIKSAAANAENTFQLPSSELKIIKIFADGAKTMKRFRARARGRATPVLRRSSHITVVVAGQES